LSAKTTGESTPRAWEDSLEKSKARSWNLRVFGENRNGPKSWKRGRKKQITALSWGTSKTHVPSWFGPPLRQLAAWKGMFGGEGLGREGDKDEREKRSELLVPASTGDRIKVFSSRETGIRRKEIEGYSNVGSTGGEETPKE